MKQQKRNQERKNRIGTGKRMLAIFMAALMIMTVPDDSGYGMSRVQAQSMQETETRLAEETETTVDMETEPATENEPENETASETPTEAETESESETETEGNEEPETETETEVNIEPESETETEGNGEPETETEVEVNIEPESETETEGNEEPETESETENGTEPETEAESETEKNSETETDSEFETEEETTEEAPEEESLHETEVETEIAVEKAVYEAQNIIFANGAEHMEYKIMNKDGVDLLDGLYHTYSIDYVVEKVEFAVTATGKYEPVVVFEDQIEEGKRTLEPVEKTEKKGETVYTYIIDGPFNGRQRREIVHISETIKPEQVKLSFKEEEVSVVSASVNGKEILAKEEDNADGCTYEVVYDSCVTFSVVPKENCKITGAVTTSATTKKEKVKANGFTFSIKVKQDSETVITSEALYKTMVYEEETPVEAVKGVHTLTYGNQYSVRMLRGEKEEADIQRVEVLLGKKEAKSKAELSEDKKTALLIIDPSEAGKKLTVKTTTGEGENEKVSTATLKVLPVIRKVAVSGVKKEKLTQTSDSVKEYKITITPKTAAATLGVEVTATGETPTEEEITEAQEVVSAKVEGNKLILTTAVKEVQPDAAVVRLYNKATSTEEEKDYVAGGTFCVSTKEPTLVNLKPSVSLKNSDDDSLTLTLGAKKAEVPNRGKVYYKVEITPQKPKEGTIPASIMEATAEPFYIEKTGASQEETLLVNNCGAGNGQAWKYDVTVTLLQTGSDVKQLDRETEEVFTLFRTAEGKEGKKKGLATKTPCYETKLKLKKGTTTIYSKQKEIVVATVQFGKKTTFTGLTVEDVSHGERSGLDLEVKGNQILVSVQDIDFYDYGRYPVIGTHTLEVAAESPENQSKVTARIKIKVVPSIEELTMESPTRMYKAEKKATSIHASVKYNINDDYYRFRPHKEKITWSIVDAEGNPFEEGDALYGMLTVKNGKVTLNKKYIVSVNEADNQFRIKVAAADFKGNPTCSYSEIITITTEELEFGEVIWARNLYYGDKRIIARSGNTLPYDEAYNIEIMAVKKGAPEKDLYGEYSADEVIDNCNVKVTSSTNAVEFYASTSWKNRIENINKPFKNATFTVTALDGSGKKATLKNLSVTYSGLPVGIEVEYYKYYANGASAFNWGGVANEKEAREINYYNCGDATLMDIYILQGYSSTSWSRMVEGDAQMSDFSIQFKGCKVLSGDKKSEKYLILVSGEEATILLKYKNLAGERFEKEYKIKNKTYSKNKALKLKQTGTLKGGYVDKAQRLTYTLPDSYDWKGKYAYITPVLLKTEKERKSYEDIEIHGTLFLGKYIPINEDGTIELEFKLYCSITGYWEQTAISKGTYSLLFNFGSFDEEGNFIPDAKPTKVTYKIK